MSSVFTRFSNCFYVFGNSTPSICIWRIFFNLSIVSAILTRITSGLRPVISDILVIVRFSKNLKIITIWSLGLSLMIVLCNSGQAILFDLESAVSGICCVLRYASIFVVAMIYSQLANSVLVFHLNLEMFWAADKKAVLVRSSAICLERTLLRE